MESKVCKVSNPKRNHSDDDEDKRESKQRRRPSSRDRHSTRDNYEGRKYSYGELKVGDPYYSGGIVSDNHKKEDRYKDDSRQRGRRRSRDRHEKENRSRNSVHSKGGKIGAPYYSGGKEVVERESGEESSNDEDNKVGQRYYSTEAADGQRKNSENYWNKFAKKDKKPNVYLINLIMIIKYDWNKFIFQDEINDVPLNQKKTVELLTSKTGGAYIPPAKLRMMQESITDKSRY